jgi:dihydrofolate synthase / folylpolyglutamate synthase
VKWGLGRSEAILAAVGDPHREYAVLHVGGTNGKGSVARIQAGILQAAGRRTGLYTSPHLVSFRERILVDGEPLSDDFLEACARELLPLYEAHGPSFFEAATALAFLAFARSGVEVAAVEVGLGGRLDATNVVSPVAVAITNVTLEHREMLGDTVEAIAGEKAGILKPGVPAFTTEEDPRVLEVLRREAEARGASLEVVAPPAAVVGPDGSRFTLDTGAWGELELASPLLGRHQTRNVALAVRTVEALRPGLRPGADAVLEGVLGTRVPGRLQVEREGDTTWILDVAHNPAGVRSLVEALGEAPLPGPRVGVVGVLADKDWPAMLRELSGVLDRVVLTVPDSAVASRRWDPNEAAGLLGEKGVAIPRLDEALERARGLAGPGGTVLVTGSFHTVGDALRELGRTPREALPPSGDFG